MKTSRAPHDRAAALIIVLSFLILLSGLMVAFLSLTRNDVTNSADYVAGQESLALSESATNLVMAQIREATLSGIDSNGVGSHAWASQPGALRVWDDEGNLVNLYKLYSAKRMQEEDLTFLNGEIPADWRSRPDEYTDLNEPVASGTSWRYPILDPGAIGTVAGFSSNQTDESAIAWDTRTSMPVRWLYLNRNGEMTDSQQPDSVGRIAFWTDDESSKVNINTASAARLVDPKTAKDIRETADSFWDIPATRFQQDYDAGRGSPHQAEFQRYAGHPASVNLLAVFAGPNYADVSTSTLRSVFDLTPRYRWGGSENGSIDTIAVRNGTAQLLTGAHAKNERLYASADELRFAPTSLSGTRNLNPLPQPPASPPASAPTEEALLDRWRFFLTAQSRSPDLNLFGRPRVSLWPISGSEGPLYRTVYDSMIARCATLGPMDETERREYFFKRLFPLSQSKDWNNFPRNQTLFQYLRNLTSAEIPGFGGNYVTKYDVASGGVSGERDQILVEMFDYIRTVNLNETYAGIPAGFQSYTPMVTGTIDSATASNFAGAGFVLPIQTPYGRGAGRVPTLSEMALALVNSGTTAKSGTSTVLVDSERVSIRPLLETFSPMQGLMPWVSKNFIATVSSGVTLGNEQLPIIPNGSVTIGPSNSIGPAGFTNIIGGTDGFAWYNPTTTTSPLFHSDSAVISGPTILINGGTVSISFAAAGEPPYQTFEIDFPDGATLPRPVFSGSKRDVNAISGIPWRFTKNDVIHSVIYRDGDYRIAAYLEKVPSKFFKPHPRFGSTHPFAHTLIHSTGQFSISRIYPVETGKAPADGALFGKYIGASYLFKDSSEVSVLTNTPDISPEITDLRSEGWEGDWNNGIGVASDGAYLGKSDEGHLPSTSDPAYYNLQNWLRSEGFFSPTRQVPSAGVFGSLPTAVKRTAKAYAEDKPSDARPWRTLLFSPNPDAGSGHYGMSDPPDYLLLDLFHLPVVEPYAISEPTSTAGRLNMNYQILPFTSIVRKTAMHAVLSGKKVTAIPTSASLIYKDQPAQTNREEIRKRLDIDETLKPFDAKFSANELFRSAAEICSISLVPLGATSDTMATWWHDYRLTGDNVRERPYTALYPLLTTKSNTFTVHIRAQSLAPKTFKATGEYRGSVTIERYLDPNDSRLPGGSEAAIDPDTQSLEPLYRFRIIDTKRFAP